MITGNNVLGIIFSNAYEDSLTELTAARAMGSVPFCGRYRLIDFPLSSMVNAGMDHVGVITKSNYQSLMDHLGNGKPWDLSRKRKGLHILPPFNSAHSGIYRDRIQALSGILGFIRQATEDYVLLCDCNVVSNTELTAMFDEHERSGADITIACKRGKSPALRDHIHLELGDDKRAKQILLSSAGGEECVYSLNVFMMRKSLLERLINNAVSLNQSSFERDIIQKYADRLNIHGSEVADYVCTIDSLQSYYNHSMELLGSHGMFDLFPPERPIYTKVRDDMPAMYGLGSSASNSLIADGCVIEGTVENSILFRGVHIAKGAVVKNSIIMQGSYVGEDAHLECVITDKSVMIKPHKVLCGADDFPIYVGKGLVV